MEEEAVIVDDNGNIVLNDKLLIWKPDSFKDEVAGLVNINNLTLQQEEYSEKLEVSNPDYSHRRKHYSEISEQPAQNYSSICSDYSRPRTEYSDLCAEGSGICTDYSDPRAEPSEKPEVEPPASCNKGENEPKMDTNDADDSRWREQPGALNSLKMANPDSSTDVFPDQITSEIAKEHISELQAEFSIILSKKLLFSHKQIANDIQSMNLTSAKLFIALACVYVAVAGGYKLRDIRGALLDVAKHPDKWPAVNPLELSIRLRRIRQADSAG